MKTMDIISRFLGSAIKIIGHNRVYYFSTDGGNSFRDAAGCYPTRRERDMIENSTVCAIQAGESGYIIININEDL